MHPASAENLKPENAGVAKPQALKNPTPKTLNLQIEALMSSLVDFELHLQAAQVSRPAATEDLRTRHVPHGFGFKTQRFQGLES